MAIPLKDFDLAPYAANWNERLATDYATFGFTLAQAEALTAVYQPYADAWAALQAARTAGVRSQADTSDKESAKIELLRLLREMYATLQASQSVSEGNKNLLGVASRSSQRTPLAAPGAVSSFTFALAGNGALHLKWKADNPAGAHGTIYEVWRKTDQTPLTFCGTTGVKRFVDSAFPASASTITYQIRAVRSTKFGPWNQFNVSFGTASQSAAMGVIAQHAMTRAA